MYMNKRQHTNIRFLSPVFLLPAILFLAAALSACGNRSGEMGKKAGAGTEAEAKAFGIDFMQELAFQSPEQIVCGQASAWAVTRQKDDFIYQFEYETDTAEIKEIQWQQGEGETLLDVVEQGGRLYAAVQITGDGSIEIRRCSYGQWDVVCAINAKDVKWEWYTVGGGFFVDGSENAYLVSGDTVTRFGAGGQRACEYELGGEPCFFQENREGLVECLALGTGGILLYELKENQAEERWTLDVPARQVCGIRSSQEETLCLATEGELLFVDRESGSLLARTDLVMMGVPSVLAGVYNGNGAGSANGASSVNNGNNAGNGNDANNGNSAGKETLRLYGADGADLSCVLLSGRDGNAEQRTELVYGTTTVNNSMKSAVKEFNQTNENYYITIRDYSDDWDRQRLHADMAGGNGPDIIEMEDAEYYLSYVRNGYLEDLSPYLEQSEYRDDIIWNVLDAYEVDGGVYLLAPQFMLEGIVIHPEYAADVKEWNREAFLELIEENQWEKDIFDSGGDPERLLRTLLEGWQDELIDWEGHTASFEGPEFMEILELCREYEEQKWPDTTGWSYEEHQWNTLFAGTTVWDFYAYLGGVGMYGRDYRVYGFPTSSGEAYPIRVCPDCCGIYAGSGHKEGAWEFVESLLGESHHNWSGIKVNSGLPIRRSLLEQMEEEVKKPDMGMRVGDSTVQITDSEIAIVEDIIYHGEVVRSLLDKDIWNIVQEETAAYFAGDKSAEEAAHIIQGRAGILVQE